MLRGQHDRGLARPAWVMRIILLVGLALAGCGVGNSAAPAGEAREATADAVGILSVGNLGWVLTDPAGLTLYYFAQDEPGSGRSMCDAACTASWQPVAAASASVAKPAPLPAALETIRRGDGTLQLTYAGRPLYRFIADTSPGEIRGSGTAQWLPASVELACDCYDAH